MQLEEGRKSQHWPTSQEERGDDNTRNLFILLFYHFEKKHFTCIRGKTEDDEKI